MANEKGQGTRGADVKNLQACYQLMLGGAMDDAGVLVESYLATHDIDAESAPITLAYVMRTVEVTKCIRGEKFEAQKIDIENALAKEAWLLSSIENLSTEEKEKLFDSYMPTALCLMFDDDAVEGERLYAFLQMLGENAKNVLYRVVQKGQHFAKKFAPLLEKEGVTDYLLSALEPFYSVNKETYGRELLAFGREAVAAGCFESALVILDNASYHLKDLSECRFLELCATLGVKNEFEFLRAENFSKQMPEYINLLLAVSSDKKLTAYYTELAEKNLSGEFYGTELAYVRDGDFLYFGEYPQTLKADDVTITSKRNEKGYYLGSDGAYYEKVKATPYLSHYEFQSGEKVVDKKTYYFKVEPIRWRILEEKEDGTALLLSEVVLDSSQYEPYRQGVTFNARYIGSALEYFVTGPFRQKAFDSGEQNCLIAARERYCMIPVEADVRNEAYGFCKGLHDTDPMRVKIASDYARATGCGIGYVGDTKGFAYWWLASPTRRNTAEYMEMVHLDGNIDEQSPTSKYGGVCPLIIISLKAIRKAKPKATPKTTPKAEKASEEKTGVKGGGKKWKLPLIIGAGVVALVALIVAMIFLLPSACFKLRAEYIEFGEYPQSLIKDGVTVDESVQDARGYYLGSDGAYYAKLYATPYATDCEFENGTPVVSDAYYYFKVEPIRWRVLTKEDGKKMLLCDRILANMPWGNGETSYPDCSLRTWLNGEFFDVAFNDEEKAAAIKPFWSYDNGTEDIVFLLSLADSTRKEYGFNDDTDYRNCIARQITVSDYARAQGVYTYIDLKPEGKGYWWLRTSTRHGTIFITYPNGAVCHERPSNTDGYGVVPAMWIHE